VAGGVDEAREWLRRARESLDAAELLMDRGFFRDSISQSYYAMFYAAKAAIVSEGQDVSKHSAVISAFGQRFSKPGRVPARLHRSLINAFDERLLADYTLDWPSTREAAEARLTEAEEFVAAVAKVLNIQP
jgi:uncharacterized protein (UPF0332 family)